MNTILFQLRPNSLSSLFKFTSPSLIIPSIQSITFRSLSHSFVLSRLGSVRCYSSKKGSKKKKKSIIDPIMRDDKDKDSFFVVRKGDIVGVYKTFSDCQSQVGSSVTDLPVSVYKGYSFPKDAEEHLISHGLKNALYTIKASDLKDDLFGTLEPCPLQEPSSSKGETSSLAFPQKRPVEIGLQDVMIGLQTIEPSSKHPRINQTPSNQDCCILEFDGASKGNPGQAGAGAVLRAPNGTMICKIRQGLGLATNNVAEYRAIILGLRKALDLGYTSIQAKGDSKLVCMQLQGLWKVKKQNMSDLHAEAKKLKDKFSSFEISHVLRDLNSDADAQANLGVALADGLVHEEHC